VIDVRVGHSAIESNLATKKCIADDLFLAVAKLLVYFTYLP